MNSNERALSNHGEKENVIPEHARQLSRSPHPYHRRQQESWQEINASKSSSLAPRLTPNAAAPHSQDGDDDNTYFDADHRKRRKSSSSTSESGTEADDEKGAFLGLPAPPLRPRKGLKDGYGTASPLLTPSALDDDTRKLALETQTKRRAHLQNQASTDEETKRLREKFTRRRRAELIRRITETALLSFVSFVAGSSDFLWLFQLRAREISFPTGIVSELDICHISQALSAYAAVIFGLYALYPLRIVLKNHARNLARKRSRFCIHIPAAFDPAPLLYPTVIPAIVALSLLHAYPGPLVANLILGIASVPSKIIPFSDDVSWYNSPHWLLSTGPLLFIQNWNSKSGPAQYEIAKNLPQSPENEELLLLYLLHQALLPVLGHLTTTSLLPAELQLLSVSMINILLFACSPQAIILKSLLWLGGLSVLILCGKVLSWGVALARIPSWRFRRPRSQNRRHFAVIETFDECINGRLSRWGLISADSGDSDSGEQEVQRTLVGSKRYSRKLKLDTHHQETSNPTRTIPMSATGDGFPKTNGTFVQPQAVEKRRRRYTLPSYVGSPLDSPSRNNIQRSRITRPHHPTSLSFRSLTAAQATVVRWTYAIYVYVVVIALIAIPIRLYISRRILEKQEPVGWALGYLLGDVPLFRTLIEIWNLDRWIRLPGLVDGSAMLRGSDWSIISPGRHLGSSTLRLLICVYCLSIIVAGLAIVFRLRKTVEVDTRRKVFHGMMVAMFLPTIFVDPAFVSLALILILAIFLLLDLFRASQLPPLSRPLTYFLAPYVDGRDHRGPVIVSHIFLLIGCAIPLWLSLAATQRTGNPPWAGWDVSTRDLSMTSGVVCVGMGDAAASLIGRRFGRRRWCWSGGKSLEGSLAFAMAVVLGLSVARLWLLLGGWDGDSGDAWATTLAKGIVAATGASLTEAVLTGGNDNVIVPIILWLLVRGLRI